MPVYKDKSHEELRWEDYQRGDKGGPLSAGQSSGINFGSSTTISNLLGPTPLFGQSSSSLFSSSISSNLFAPETPGFGSTGFGTSSSAFSSSSFGASSTPGLFQSSSLSTPSLFGSTYAFGSSSSPSPFSSSSTGFGQSVFSSPQVQGSAPVFSSSLFSSFAPPIGQAGAAFVHSTSLFGQTVSGFGQSSLFSTPSTGFGNLLTSTPSIGTSINPLGFSQSAGEQMGIHVSFSIQCVISQMKNDNGINPFGTLPAIPQMSIGCGGTAPSVQYGIASMLVLDKPAPVRISSSLTSRYVSQRRIRLPARKYHHKNDGPKG